MAFNDEAVVRAAAESKIPMISAVGHETDTTLIDFASDRRAPTPTAAAEMAVPSQVDLAARIMQLVTRLNKALIQIIQSYQLRLNKVITRLPDVPTLLAQNRMRLDDRFYRLDLALPALVLKRRHQLSSIQPVNQYLLGLIDRFKRQLAFNEKQYAISWLHYMRQLKNNLPLFSISNVRNLLRERQLKLESVTARLEALSPKAVLARGYVLVQNKKGQAVTEARGLRAGSDLILTFYDGQKDVRVLKRQVNRQESFDL